MSTKTFARIADATVVELIHTDHDVKTMFHPSLHWVDVTGKTLAVGWLQTAAGFSPPAAPPPEPLAPPPTLAELQAELAVLATRIAAFANAQKPAARRSRRPNDTTEAVISQRSPEQAPMPTPATHAWRPSTARCVVLDGFVPVPRGVIPAAPAALVWPAKDPGDVLDYEFDVSAAVVGNDGDSISTIDVVTTPSNAGDLAVNSTTADGTVVVLWLASGQSGTTYTVQITVGTTNGRTVNRAILLPVQSLAAPAVPTAVLTTDTSAVVTDQNGNPILVGS